MTVREPQTASLPTKSAAPVQVEVAQTGDLVGTYSLSDPARSTAQYHGTVILNADGTGRVREFINGKPPAQLKYPDTADAGGYVPLHWSYRDGVFIYDPSLGGRLSGLGVFRGQVAGNTHDFVLEGHWVSGTPGRMRFRR